MASSLTWRRWLAALLWLTLGGQGEAAARPPLEHVFVIVLENEDFAATFGAQSPAPYLAQTLPRQGVMLEQYFATGHVSLDNYIAMISGQAGTPETRLDCHVFQDFALAGIAADGQAIGKGCVYPAAVKSLPDQLQAISKTWRGYMEDMGNDPEREAATCGHPPLDAPDRTQKAEAPSERVPRGDQYAARHNPFVYFHSIIDSADCDRNVVNLDRLPEDLRAEATTPNFVFISPNLCHDGHDEPCRNGEPGGLVSADRFLRQWVPIIMESPAYRRAGLLIVTFDESGLQIEKAPDGRTIISAAGETCCEQQPGPNLGAFPQSLALRDVTLRFQSFGGDRIGAVLLSPFLAPGTVSTVPFNHYSLLRTVEDIFGLDHLGYAAQPSQRSFFSCLAPELKLRRAADEADCARQ